MVGGSRVGKRWQAGRIRGFTQNPWRQLGGVTTSLKCFGDNAFDACKEKKGGSVTSLISTDSTQLSLAISVFREDTL